MEVLKNCDIFFNGAHTRGYESRTTLIGGFRMNKKIRNWVNFIMCTGLVLVLGVGLLVMGYFEDWNFRKVLSTVVCFGFPYLAAVIILPKHFLNWMDARSAREPNEVLGAEYAQKEPISDDEGV